MLDDNEYIRSNVIDSISQSGGLVVLQLVRRSDGLYDIFVAKRGRLPEIFQTSLPMGEAREFWSKALFEMFKRMMDEQEELEELVDGRIRSLFP